MAISFQSHCYMVKSISNPQGNTCEVELKFYVPEFGGPTSSQSDIENLSTKYARGWEIPDEVTVNHIVNGRMRFNIGDLVWVCFVRDEASIQKADGTWHNPLQLIEKQELIPV